MKSNKKKMFSLLFIVILFLVYGLTSSIEPDQERIPATLVQCVDGDTMVLSLNDQPQKIRLLAVDTPEQRQPYYRVASNFTCDLLQNSNQIAVEMDDNATLDAYDRVLGWVWVDDDLLQAELIENGYAKVAYLYDDYKYTEKLHALEKIAKQERRNIWR